MPWLWASELLMAVPVAALYARAADRWPRRALVRALFCSEALLLGGIAVAAWLGVPRSAYTAATYVVSSLDVLVVRVAVWTLATEALPADRAPKLLPRIAGVLTVVDLVSYTASGLFSWQLGQGIAHWDPAVLALSASGFGAAAAIAGRGTGSAPALAGPEAVVGPGLRALFGSVPGLPALAVAVTGAWASMSALQLYNLLATERAADGDEGALRALYAGFGCATLVVVWLVQLGASRWLERIAPVRALHVLPTALLACVGLAAGVPGLLGAWLADGLHYVGYDGWDTAARFAWMARLPEAIRGRAMALVETQAYVAGSLAGALVLGSLGMWSADGDQLAAICLVVAGACATVAWLAVRRIPTAGASSAPVQC